MLTPNNFIQLWNKYISEKDGIYANLSYFNKRVRFNPAVVHSLSIPNASKEFLIQAGLPNLFISSGANALLPKLADIVGVPHNGFSVVHTLPSEFDGYRFIGRYGFDSAICLNTSRNGRIELIFFDEKPENEPQISFINSSIQQFAEAQFCFIKRIDLIDELRMGHPDRPSRINAFELELKSIDPEVFVNKDNHWQNIILRARDGWPLGV